MTGTALSTRSMLVRDKLMRTAEKLYAEHGLANVSIRRIGMAAGQRNMSAVQYHFTNRDGLIKAILARHTAAVEQRRMAMVTALDGSGGISLQERMACLVLPTMEHFIELGTPSWYGRFFAQIQMEPGLRAYAIRLHLRTPSIRRLDELGPRGWRSFDVEFSRNGAMLRQFAVHMCAELEHDLACGRVDPAAADVAWRQLAANVMSAICGLPAEVGDLLPAGAQRPLR